MRAHFRAGLRVADLLREYEPGFVVELGAGDGGNTEQMLEIVPVEVISDGLCPARLEPYVSMGRLTWTFYLSHLVLPEYADDSIPFAIVDTDHNYWTLDKELTLLEQKVPAGGIVCVHDTQAFKYNNGYMDHYECGVPYRVGLMMTEKPYAQAVTDHLGAWEVVRESKESCGAVALRRRG